MRLRPLTPLKPRSSVVVLAFSLATLLVLQIGAVVARSGGRTPPVAAPVPVRTPTDPAPSVVPTPSPAVHRARPTPKPSAAPSRAAVFGGLGAWIDVYDFDAVAPEAAVASMSASSVRTLYIQTGRHNTPHAIAPEVGPWLLAAHRAGLKVVGWYLPGYHSMSKDIERSVAVARYRYRGEGFDGLGIDIEDKSKVRHVATWNRRVVTHARAVRARLGGFPIATITPVPIQMTIAPARWAGFPWKELGPVSDAVMLMSYWSFRSDCPSKPEQCAYGYTAGNIRRARALIGMRGLPIHVIGGVADLISVADVADFVRASRDTGAYGASLYDFRTTDPSFWKLLRTLVRL